MSTAPTATELDRSTVAEFDRECFFITAIGMPDSPERKRADGTLRAIVEPSAEAAGLVTIRADKIEEGGHITLQILEHCTNAKAAVADLTGGNLNVYYEVGIRHALSRPLVLIADESMRDALPFDLLQQRTIFYTDTLEGAASARDAVSQQLRRALSGSIDSPVQAAANLRSLQQGDAVQQTLAQLVSQVAELPTALERVTTLRRELPAGMRRQIREELALLSALASEGDGDDKLQQVVERLGGLLGVARATAYTGEGPPALSQQIRALRQDMGLSLEHLAERCGLHLTELVRIEQGRRNPSFSTLTRIAAGLELPLSELIRLAESPRDDEDSGD